MLFFGRDPATLIQITQVMVKLPIRNQKFEVNEVYEKTYVGDSQLKPKMKCIGRTKCFVELAYVTDGRRTRRKITLDSDNNEMIFDGSYSFAPCVSSKRKVTE